MKENSGRYVGLDVHKHSVMVGAMNGQQQVVLQPRRVAMLQFAGWAQEHLKRDDRVVLEASANSWEIHDLLEPLVAEVMVVHPNQVKLIASSSVKTDKRDTLALARLCAAGLLTSIWIPTRAVRDLRALVAHRQRLVRQRVAARNRLHAVLHAHNLTAPTGDPFQSAHREWWLSLPLSTTIRLRIRHDLALMDHASHLIQETESELARLSTGIDDLPFMMQLSGIGLLTAMTLISAIGDIRRFPTAKQLVGYSGLGARIHASGQAQHGGRITKTGRRELRTVLVEAAWSAVRYHAHWRQQYQTLAARIGRSKAIVAIARKLLVAIWHVLSKRELDRHAQLPTIARKFLIWASKYRLASSMGLSRYEFVAQQWQRLGLDPTELTNYLTI
jgi:transposase